MGFTAFARIPRQRVISVNVQPGDVIVGLASYGQASYESEYNSGIGSNGLTSARHDLLGHYLFDKYPESFNPDVPEELVYAGSREMMDIDAVTGETVGKLLLSPTRTYAPVINQVLKNSVPVNGIIHCSGGGQTKVMKFVEGVHIVKDNLFDTPPLFSMIRKESETEWREMYEVFNMGHRMEVYLSDDHAKEVIDIAKSFNIEAKIIGRVEAADESKLTIEGSNGLFTYPAN